MTRFQAQHIVASPRRVVPVPSEGLADRCLCIDFFLKVTVPEETELPFVTV